MLSLFSLLENIYSGSRLALLPPCDCGLLWLLVLLLIGNLKRLVMLRCQAAALPSRAKPGQACNWCVAIEVFAMHGCLCLEAASASASASASAWASAQVALCVFVCVRVLKLHASRSNNGNEIYRQNFAQRLLLQVMFAGDLNSHVTYTQSYSTHTHTRTQTILYCRQTGKQSSDSGSEA